MSAEAIQGATRAVERMIVEIKRERVARFDLQYPVGHSEREARMPDEIRVLKRELAQANTTKE